MFDERFHPLPGLAPGEDEANRPDFRRFEVKEATPHLLVPGLQSVSAVRVGSVDLPFQEARQYPLDGTGKNLETVAEPVVQLVATEAGPVLLRSKISNHGVWQVGTVYVAGEWDGSAGAGADAAAESEAAAR